MLLILATFYWAARILMVKGAAPPWLARIIFRCCRNGLHFVGDLMSGPKKRRELWALYIPVSLLAILGCSLALAAIGFTLLLYGVTENSLSTAYVNSVSSMSVLGIAGKPPTLRETTIAGVEAFTGPVFVALLIAYTVSIYSAYSDYRSQIESMDQELGKNQNGLHLLQMICDPAGAESLSTIWKNWAAEYTSLDSTYRSVDGYLLFYSPEMSEHWANDGPMVLDSAALRNTLIAGPPDPAATACLAAGNQGLDHIAQHYTHRVLRIRRHRTRQAIGRPEFDSCAWHLTTCGVDVVPDLDAAWSDFERLQGTYEMNVEILNRMLPIGRKK
ncbi:MAG: hypothetical protein QM758_27895 [Armatimonas sp.]